MNKTLAAKKTLKSVGLAHAPILCVWFCDENFKMNWSDNQSIYTSRFAANEKINGSTLANELKITPCAYNNAPSFSKNASESNEKIESTFD